MAAAHAGSKLRELLQTEFLILPGAFNGISARLAAKNGFRSLYLSGGQLEVSSGRSGCVKPWHQSIIEALNGHTLMRPYHQQKTFSAFTTRAIWAFSAGAALTAAQGLPDVGLATAADFARVIKEMVTVASLPILADAETGFGDSQMVVRTVHEYNSAGAAGLHVEDQEMPKRCGHLADKTVVPVSNMTRKLARAVEASQKASAGNFLICARTDSFAVEGLEGAVERARKYVEAGAEMIFPEALTSEKAFKHFASAMRQLPGPAPGGGPFLLANMTEFGVTPMMKAGTLRDAGFHCAIYPVSALRTALKAMDDMYAELSSCKTLKGQLTKMYDRKELYETLQYSPPEEWIFPSASYSSAQ